MKRLAELPGLKWFALAALLAVFSALRCQAIEISPPPPEVAVGDDVELAITGLTGAELSAGTLIHFPRDRVRVRGSSEWGGLYPRIDFRARLPGRYLVAISATVEGQHEYAEVIIVVGDGGPGPDPFPQPDPKPDPEPGPVKELAVAVIYEQVGRSTEEWATLNNFQLYLSDEKINHRLADKDKIDGKTRKTPTWLAPLLAEVKQKKLELPAVIIVDGSGADARIVASETLVDLVRATEMVERFRKPAPPERGPR